MRYDGYVSSYHVENFGCRATQADGAAIERQFENRGLSRSSAAEADLVILNTCTVTNSADRDARAAVRRVRRQNPLAKIIVTGCYAQRAPEEIAALPGVSVVIGNSHKHQLAEIVLPNLTTNREGHISGAANPPPSMPALAAEVDGAGTSKAFLPLSALTENRKLRTENWVFVSDIFAHTELLAAPVFESTGGVTQNARTRPNLKVQDGCDNRCSFCVIPSVRGHSKSLPLAQILREVHALVAAGYREAVISGINLGRWGSDFETGFRHLGTGNRKPNFPFLLRSILAETQLEKLRISSVEPMDWNDDLIALVASSARIARHAHLPLQSGSDAVLRRMHRKYRPWHYREKIEKIHAAMPTAAIGADVMAGFPSETDAEFEATRRLVEELPFTYLHVFTYSARPGTRAAAMPKQVPIQVARERNRVLRDLAARKTLAFMHSFVGQSLEAITLGSANDRVSQADFPYTEALTDNYQKLYLKGRHASNRWITANIERVENGALVGSSKAC
jgi:threonylcarbamoyladenosine tRNA methylthiotransferase MtaB